jgi:RND family efflux transporter MFP subunit
MQKTFGKLGPLLVASLSGCDAGPPRPVAGEEPRVVQVVTAERGDRPVVTEVVGTVRAAKSASIGALISGTIAELRVGMGSSVRQGEVLARLSAGEVHARLDQTRALSLLAERERERATNLLDHRAISVAAYDAAMSQWTLAQARQAEASTILSHAVLRAPFDGVVTAKLANVGEAAMPGQPLLVLEAPLAHRFEARVPEAARNALELGDLVPVRLDGLGHDITGTIAELQPVTDDATRTRLAKLDLPPSPELWSGRFGRLLLVTGAQPTVSVPANAVVRRGQLEGVFVVDAGTARLRLVRSGRLENGRLAIASGLSGRERVVMAGAARLVDGQRVEVAP